MVWLIIAIIALLLGHIVKVYRWRLFIELYEKPSISMLMKSLSVAHAINFVIPLHVGDLYRIIYSGRKMTNGIKFSLATIIVEHYIDLIVLALICAVLFAIGHNTIGTMILLMTLATTAVFLTVVSMKWDSRSKHMIVSFSEVFNPKIELSILGFIWTFVSIFKKLISSLSKTMVVLSTGLMWVLYMASYWCIAEALQSIGVFVRLRDVVDIFFNRSSIIGNSLYGCGGDTMTVYLYLSAYVLSPLLIIYLASYGFGQKKSADTAQDAMSSSVIPHVNSRDALAFLETFFKGNLEGAYLKGFLEVNKDVSILEDHSAGSNAVTLLCTNGTQTFYRKFAIGADGKKLYEQIKWLQAHRKVLPLPSITAVNMADTYCSYDMAYDERAVNFFTYIHTHSTDHAWLILRMALDNLHSRLYRFDETADAAIVSTYIEKKVTKNLNLIMQSATISGILSYDEVYINGVRYGNFEKVLPLLDAERLMKVFADSPIADIHGDLTIENIICTTDSYYLIDPNTGNVLECPYLDLAKLFQSLHGGYEFLMRVQEVSVRDNHIDFTYMRSSAYDELYQLLCQYVEDKYGKDVLRQVYYHELVHWLRLMPYKLSHLGEKALVFYAGMLMVFNDVMQKV